MNRLKLNFSLPTVAERKDFLDRYLQNEQFKIVPPTSEEIETCANYLLYGKDNDGKNCVQRKEVEIQPKNSTWAKKEIESLDALLETPTFNENQILCATEARPKVVKEIFSRQKALKNSPPEIQMLFRQLFNKIDATDCVIEFYELAHNKRKKPLREELRQAFNEEELSNLEEQAKHLNAYQYLKMRHQLVELRREQFSLRDTYSTIIQCDPMKKTTRAPETWVLDADVPVLPFGIKKGRIAQVFAPLDTLVPKNFSEEDIEWIIKKYWENEKRIESHLFFDFRNPDHLYNLIAQLEDLKEETNDLHFESTLNDFFDTFLYYADCADLNECQRIILKMKIAHKRNVDIADYVNEKFGKNYTVNYISTIFRQKIIKKIAEYVTYHEEVILSLPYPEAFKQCSTCKKFYLRDPHNFVRKTRSKDGFTSRCKNCDKIKRN